jgi:putative ABC transport system permease protein
VLALQVQTSGPRFREPDAVRRYFENVRIAALGVPGVSAAALTSQLPLTGNADIYGVLASGEPAAAALDRSAYRYGVSATYFGAMGIPLRRGRGIEERDRRGTGAIAVVSESLARHRFPGREAVGERVRIGGRDVWYTVVGVVGDVKQSSLAMSAPDAVYVPEAQGYFIDRSMWIVLRTSGDPKTIAPEVRRTIRTIDPDQPILHVATMEERMAASAGLQRVVMLAFNVFAVVALLLAAIGIYAVLAGGVAERTREFGVRSAVGASRASIIGLVVRHGAGAMAIGTGLGLVVAVVVSRGLTTLLYGVTPLDAITYAGVLALLLIAAVAGGLIPAWRAARIAPALALQAD